MAGNIKKPVILDFFGLPGCGKSTVSHLAAERLRQDGYLVNEPSFDLDHNFSPLRRKLIKLGQYILYSVLHPVKAKRISDLVRDNGYMAFSDKLSQCINIAAKFSALRKTGCNYIIFDEGIFQAAISLTFENRGIREVTSNYERMRIIDGLQAEVKSIYMQIGVETALRRLEQRGESNSRVDAEKDSEKRRQKTESFRLLCESISKCCTIKVNGEISPVEITTELVDYLHNGA